MGKEEAKITVKIGGMVAMSCVDRIEGQIGKQLGVVRISVFLQKKLAEIFYDPGLTSVEKLCRAIEEIGFEAKPSEHDDIVNEGLDVSETVVKVEGMVCMSCVDSIEAVIGDRPGVVEINVSLAAETATIKYLPDIESVESLIEAISDMGFDAFSGQKGQDSQTKKSIIDIEGMTCNSCVQSIEKMISGVEGVLSINVSLEDGNAEVMYDPSSITTEKICGEIDDMGFDASKYNYDASIVILMN